MSNNLNTTTGSTKKIFTTANLEPDRPISFKELSHLVSIGRNTLFKFLREQGVLYKMSPSEEFKQYFIRKIKQREYHWDFDPVVLILPEGVKFIEKLIKEKYKPKKKGGKNGTK